MTPGEVVIGVDDLTVSPLIVDLASTPTLVVSGPNGTGRTSLLESVRRGLVASTGGPVDAVLVAPRGNRLTADGAWRWLGSAAGEVAAALGEMAAERTGETRPAGWLLVGLDDADELLDLPSYGVDTAELASNKAFSAAMEALVRAGRDGRNRGRRGGSTSWVATGERLGAASSSKLTGRRAGPTDVGDRID